MKLYLALDYDGVTPEFILRELFHLKHLFRIGLVLYRSSENSYHIKSEKPISKPKAFEILEKSKCSRDYKTYCKQVECFPIRVSEKELRKNGEIVEKKPPPEKIFKI